MIQTTWPKADFKLDEAVDDLVQAIAARRDEPDTARRRRHWVIEDGRVVAHALVFPRTVTTVDGPLEVGALAAVCVDPGRRGGGLGRAVVAAAFADWLAHGGAVSLFQTPVPDFYRKLGARTIDNAFVNSRDETGDIHKTWWDRFVMIYPAAFPWPAGPIDLNGRAW